MRSIRALGMAGTLAVFLVACGGGGGGGGTPTGLPSGLPTGLPSGLPTGLPSGLPTGIPTGLPTGLPSGLPTGIPTGLGGALTEGSAHVVISGGTSKTLDLTLKDGAYAPGAAIAIAWLDSSSDTFSIGGVAFTGTAKTSGTLALTVAVISPPTLLASTAGECTLNLTDATSSHVKGTADCQNLSGGVNLHAEFEATG
jgi:hypothetical protein